MFKQNGFRLWGVLGLIVVTALFGLAGIFYFNRPYTYQGSVINPPFTAPGFTLTDQNGQPFSLSQTQGKVDLIFFGYTHCPDVCPATMAEFKQIKTQLGSQADQVNFIFISVDPANDPPARVKVFVDEFDPAFIGLTGTRAQLEPVWKAYGVYTQPASTASSTPSPDQIEHSSQIYLVNPKGQLIMTYGSTNTVQGMTADIQHVLQGR